MKRYIAFLVINWGLSGDLSLFAQSFQLNTSSNISAIGRGSAQSADINNDDYLDIVISGINEVGTHFSAIYINNKDNTFSNVGAGIPALSDGDITTGDINNDGLIDIFSVGINSSLDAFSSLLLNQSGGSFINSPFNFQGLAYSKCEIADLNNDGISDIIIIGLDETNRPISLLYANDGNGQFTLASNSIGGTKNGDLTLFDFDNNGYIDVLVSGLNELNQRVTQLFINNGNFNFELKNVGLPDVRSSSTSVADYNSDGYIDLFISGNQTGGTDISAVYLNNAGGGFILDQSFSPLENGASAWGDYDHDGDFDLIISGLENSDFKTYLFTNDAGNFVDSGIGFPGLTNSNMNWVDYNNDNKLDLLINGYSYLGPITNLYENESILSNTKPATPTGLSTLTQGDSVVLSWDMAFDDETPAPALTYEIYAGSAASGIDILSPKANLLNGKRKVGVGRRSSILSYTLKDLAEGVYHWGVQSIDNCNEGSGFSIENSFVLCYPISLGPDTSVCLGETLHLEIGSGTDVVNWYSREQGLIASSSHQIDFEVMENDSIYVELTKDYGCMVKTGIKITALSLPVLDLGLDQEVCRMDSISLDVGNSLSEVIWSSYRDGFLSQNSSLKYMIDQKDTLRVSIEDSNGCLSYDTLNIKVLDLPIFSLGDDQKICFGSEFNTNLIQDSVNWFSTAGISILNSNSLTFNVEKKDTVTAVVYDRSTYCHYSDTLIVDFHALPIANAGQDLVTCPETSVVLGGAYEQPNDLAFYWTPSLGLSNMAIANPTASVSSETQFLLTVEDPNKCQSTDLVTVHMDTPSITNPGANRSICIGTSTELGGEPTAAGSKLAYSYIWSPTTFIDNINVPNPIVNPPETTKYQLISYTLNCPIDTSYVTVTVDPLPKVSVDPDEVTIGFGEIINLSATGGKKYSWSPSFGLQTPNQNTTEASPEETTIYEVEVIDENSCVNYADVKVIVKNQFFIPEVFTPNDDHKNDTFKAYGEGIQELKMGIYDRNGNVVYYSDHVNDILEIGWDGYHQGIAQPNGLYVWAIEGKFFDGSSVQYQGKKTGFLKLIK